MSQHNPPMPAWYIPASIFACVFAGILILVHPANIPFSLVTVVLLFVVFMAVVSAYLTVIEYFD